MSELTDAQWEKLEPLLPVFEREPEKAGRPRVDNWKVLTGILWVLRTGAPWKNSPAQYVLVPDLSSSISRMVEDGIIDMILISLVEDL